jgi:hypothetical protein
VSETVLEHHKDTDTDSDRDQLFILAIQHDSDKLSAKIFSHCHTVNIVCLKRVVFQLCQMFKRHLLHALRMSEFHTLAENLISYASSSENLRAYIPAHAQRRRAHVV